VVWEGWSREAPPYPDLWPIGDKAFGPVSGRCGRWTKLSSVGASAQSCLVLAPPDRAARADVTPPAKFSFPEFWDRRFTSARACS